MLSRFDNKKDSKGQQSVKQFVSFQIGDEGFGVNIHQAREIISYPELTKIPNAPEFVEGVIDLRGEIVPIVDLQKRLNLNTENNEQEQKVIIVEVEEMLVGMKVDEVEGIIRLNEEDIGNAPQLARDINQSYVQGVGRMEERLLILLDLTAIFSSQEVKQLEELEKAELEE